MALKLGIQTYQILTNDYEVCIPSLSSILLALRRSWIQENLVETFSRCIIVFKFVCTYYHYFFSFQRGVAPLHLASRHGHAHLIRLLLDHGADVNLPSRGGVCGLHLSSRCGHANAVELLLDKGTIHIRDHLYITLAKRWVDGVLACVAFCHNFEGFWFPSFEVVAC